jgi:hypothetical protein
MLLSTALFLKDLWSSFYNAATPVQLLWAMCAALSVSSSKYLLLDLGFHYPFCLLLLQLVPTILLCAFILAQHKVEACQIVPPGSLISWPPLRTGLQASLVALSSALVLQATLHFPNPNILVMLSVRNTGGLYAYSSAANLAQVLGHCGEQIWLWLTCSSSKSRSQRGYLLMLLCSSCTALLYGDSQLSAVGLASVASAALALSLARQLCRGVGLARSLYAPCSIEALLSSAPALALLGLGALWKEKDAFVAITNLPSSHVAWLLANLTSAAIATTIGCSLLFPVYLDRPGRPVLAPLLALAGFTGCLSTMLLPRFYVAATQLAAYTTAILLLQQLHRLSEAGTLSAWPCCQLPVVTLVGPDTSKQGAPAPASSPVSAPCVLY